MQKLLDEKADLMARQQSKTNFTAKDQDRLDDVVMEIMDLEDDIAAANTAASIAAEASKVYTPKPGTERMYHVSMIKGKKYDSETGKLLGTPFTQMFTPGEYKHFEKFGKHLGYTQIKVLWDPTKQK